MENSILAFLSTILILQAGLIVTSIIREITQSIQFTSPCSFRPESTSGVDTGKKKQSPRREGENDDDDDDDDDDEDDDQSPAKPQLTSIPHSRANSWLELITNLQPPEAPARLQVP
ncbi:hypothetical protein HZH66_014868 [Vespula vulgaris]|uniref:Uncharacterized protein n=1 Tax=Vespula vulgaris TaxID=7454 RepID=A0A834J2J5_VESVU|nr:hypothetical protein HZH66_014868 [Vespula vulgaris]